MGYRAGGVYHSLFFVWLSYPLALCVRNHKDKFATKLMSGGRRTTSCHIVYFIDIYINYMNFSQKYINEWLSFWTYDGCPYHKV